jgi:hypothetical protein
MKQASKTRSPKSAPRGGNATTTGVAEQAQARLQPQTETNNTAVKSVSAPARKRLFLVDAMGYIFRAFYAPMDRLQTSSGIPTNVPRQAIRAIQSAAPAHAAGPVRSSTVRTPVLRSNAAADSRMSRL